MTTRHSLFLTLLPLLLGCAAPVVSLAPPPSAPRAADYERVHERWTRVGRVFSWKEFDTVLLIYATLRSPEFEQAYIARHHEVYKVADPAEQGRFQQEELGRSGASLSLLVQCSGHSYRWTYLDPVKELWRVVLVDDSGVETPAANIEPVRTQRQVLDTELYNNRLSRIYAPFTRVYNVTFPAVRGDGQPLLRPGQSRLVLRIAGPQGKVDLVWSLR